jgi:hypothetical protein
VANVRADLAPAVPWRDTVDKAPFWDSQTAGGSVSGVYIVEFSR